MQAKRLAAVIWHCSSRTLLENYVEWGSELLQQLQHGAAQEQVDAGRAWPALGRLFSRQATSGLFICSVVVKYICDWCVCRLEALLDVPGLRREVASLATKARQRALLQLEATSEGLRPLSLHFVPP